MSQKYVILNIYIIKSNNLVFHSIINHFREKRIHIITTLIEHDSVLLPLKHYKEESMIG